MPDDARAAGCNMVGANNGIGPAGLIGLLGGPLTDYTQPDEDGQVRLTRLGRFPEWPAGATGDQVDTTPLVFHAGSQVEQGIELGRELARFPAAQVRDGRVQAQMPVGEVIRFDFDFIFGGPVSTNLRGATLRGDLAVEQAGFTLENATMTGYLARQDVLAFIEARRAREREETEQPRTLE